MSSFFCEPLLRDYCNPPQLLSVISPRASRFIIVNFAVIVVVLVAVIVGIRTVHTNYVPYYTGYYNATKVFFFIAQISVGVRGDEETSRPDRALPHLQRPLRRPRRRHRPHRHRRHHRPGRHGRPHHQLDRHSHRNIHHHLPM